MQRMHNFQKDIWLQERKSLWWGVEDVTQLSDKAILEGVMNYGQWQDFLILKQVWGLKKIKKHFLEMTTARRCNLRLPTKFLFTQYLQKHAA